MKTMDEEDVGTLTAEQLAVLVSRDELRLVLATIAGDGCYYPQGQRLIDLLVADARRDRPRRVFKRNAA